MRKPTARAQPSHIHAQRWHRIGLRRFARAPARADARACVAHPGPPPAHGRARTHGRARMARAHAPADGRVCMRLLGEQRVDCIQPELAQAPRDDVDVVVDLGAQVQQLARAALRHHVRVRPERPHGLVHVLCVPARPAHAAGEDRVQQVDVVVLWADGAEGTEQQHVPVVRQVLHRGGQLVAEVGLDHHVVLEHNERAGLLVGAHLPALDVRKEAADHPRRHQHAPEERHVRHDLLGGQRLAHNRIEPLSAVSSVATRRPQRWPRYSTAAAAATPAEAFCAAPRRRGAHTSAFRVAWPPYRVTQNESHTIAPRSSQDPRPPRERTQQVQSSLYITT
eukprot:6454155-Prymnesium_polylepis.1